ncbi:TolC family protein [Massilia sp. MB5]|uniref:TolC family protein n=1 Tax=Massilia sp. MB5 TaxID=2919578 RepID=UPI001F0EC9D7|nr:TolC family protein [Massilia sp. MB5]UMR32977.1 TolC family protein [Massilia sp. MB5]
MNANATGRQSLGGKQLCKRPLILRLKPALALLLAPVVLSGCAALGPDFKAPQTALPRHWLANEQSAPGAVELAWWNSFDDPQLAALIQRAVAGNLDLQIVASRLEQSRAIRQSMGAAETPQLNAAGGISRARASQVGLGDPSGRKGESAYTLAQGGFNASWELDFWGRVRRTVEAADAQVEAAQEQRHAALLSLAAETAQHYIRLRSTQSLLAITEQNLAIARRSLELTRIRNREGVATELDVARASAQVAAIEARLPGLHQREAAGVNALGLLLAQPPQALRAELAVISGERSSKRSAAADLEGSAQRSAKASVAGGTERNMEASAGALAKQSTVAYSVPAGPAVAALGLPSELAQRRPDIRRASALLHAATASIGVAKADFYPRITLSGNLGFQATQLSDFGSWSSRQFSFGPAFSLPLFDGGHLRGMLKLSEARQQEAALAYQQTVLRAWHEVDDALAASRAQQERRERLHEAVAQSRIALNNAQQQYVAGTVDFLNVLSVQDALLANEAALAESTAAVSLALVDLYKALGGGWQSWSGTAQQPSEAKAAAAARQQRQRPAPQSPAPAVAVARERSRVAALVAPASLAGGTARGYGLLAVAAVTARP